MSKIKTGDEVVIIAGKDKGRRGKVLEILKNKKMLRRGISPKRGIRVIVEGANLVKKHVRGNPNTGEQGGIIERPAPVDISNVAIWNDTTSKADRVGFKFLEDGKKVRIFKSTGEVIDV